jgi:hypothetical protein
LNAGVNLRVLLTTQLNRAQNRADDLSY